MVVIPQDLLERMQTVSTSASATNTTSHPRSSYKSLDDEMEEILNNRKLDDNEKWKLYKQVLHQFLNVASNNRMPINLPIADAVPVKEIIYDQGQLESIIDTFSKSYKADARNLLRYITRNDSLIRWNHKYEVNVGGLRIPNSNIIDLLHSIIRVRSTNQLPPGWYEVMDTLKKMNVPREYIRNPRALQYMGVEFKKNKPNVGGDEEGDGVDDDDEESTGAIRKTPLTDRLRSAQSRRLANAPDPQQQLQEAIRDSNADSLTWDSLTRWEAYEP
jgi:hypothetical protein